MNTCRRYGFVPVDDGAGSFWTVDILGKEAAPEACADGSDAHLGLVQRLFDVLRLLPSKV